MSHSGIPGAKQVVRLGEKAAGLAPLFGFTGFGAPDAGTPSMPNPAAPNAPTPEALQQRATQDFATREQNVNAKAVAAGAVRSTNEADLLGFAPQTRRLDAKRVLLG